MLIADAAPLLAYSPYHDLRLLPPLRHFSMPSFIADTRDITDAAMLIRDFF